MKDISKEIIAKIKEEKIIPESKFKLHWKNYAFWILMGGMAFLGALSLSLVFLNLADISPRFLQHMGIGKFIFMIMMTAPYLWIILSILALIFGIMAFRQTERSYRYSTLFITSLSVLVVSMLGVFGHFLKIDNHMNKVLQEKAPRFRKMTDYRVERWARPRDGMIGGEVVSVNVVGEDFVLRSFNNEEWRIYYNVRTDQNNIQRVVVGKKVGVIGERIEEFVMKAFSVREFPDDWNGEPSCKQNQDSEDGCVRRKFLPEAEFMR